MVLGIILLLASFAVSLYYYLIRNYHYWESRGVKGPKPSIIFGTVKDVLCGKMYIGDYMTSVYKEYKKEPFVGIYIFQTPFLMLHDLEIIKDVLIRNFDKFADHAYPIYEKPEPEDNQFIVLESKKWRPLRQIISPVFSVVKLKEMFCMSVKCADNLDKYLMEKIGDSKDGAIIECRSVMSKFITDTTLVCAFGLEGDALSSENSIFRIMGESIFDVSYKTFLKYRLKVYAPSFYSTITRFIDMSEPPDFFIKVLRDTIDYRKKNNIVKHDIIEVLMTIRDDPGKVPDIASELNDSFISMQIYSFFAAAFETSTSTLSNTLYRLALNPKVQDKLRSEINDAIKRTGGIMEYNGITKLQYLDMVLKETLRMHPPITYVDRRATSDHTISIPSEKRVLNIKKGQLIYIPIVSILRDAKYFQDPDVFDPEKFSDDALKSRNPMANLFFGDGPRACIGKRFALTIIKVGLVKILQSYKVERCEKTEVPYPNHPRAFFMIPKNGINLRITRLPKTINEL